MTARDAIDVSRHATTAKGFTLCRCADLQASSIDMCQLAVCGNHNLQLSYGELEAVSATAYFCVIATLSYPGSGHLFAIIYHG